MIDLPEEYELVADAARIDPVAAHAYLTRSYWAAGIPLDTVARALANSLCVAVFHDGKQVGLARVITDRATFAYLADVYVLEEHRGKQLAQIMVQWLQDHPELQGLRRWFLMTADAHGVYEKLGWEPLTNPDRAMERLFAEVYQ